MVKAPLLLLAIAGIVTGPPGSARLGDGDGDATALKAFVPQKWEYVLPGESPLALGSSPEGQRIIPVPHQGGAGFVVEPSPTALAVDTNGDGKFDDKVKGVGGSVVLKGRTPTGTPFSYAVRIVNSAGEWRYLAAGAMVGKVAGEDLKLIDLNGNGKYDDFGADAMIVGSGVAASFLSKVIVVGGKLFELTVAPAGDSVTAKPYAGETGTLSLKSGFKTDGGELTSAVVRSENSELSFELSKASLPVPVGQYRFMFGTAKKGGESVKIRSGDSKPISVEAGKPATFAWGGPLTMDFNYAIVKDRITVPPSLKFFGAAGEEYYEFKPDAKSPKIIVTDEESKKVVQEGRFGGC